MYSAFAIFCSVDEANEAFQELEGTIEKVLDTSTDYYCTIVFVVALCTWIETFMFYLIFL